MTNQPKVEPCRSCKAPVVWAKTVNDKWAPFDAKPERRFILHPGEDGILRAESQPTYQSHYSTCPDAAKWRAGGAGAPPNDQPPPTVSETPFTDGIRKQIEQEKDSPWTDRKDVE
jgi:hypothetical protein